MNKLVQQGFTLIELMIVIAIIGILAAIAVPQYQDYIVRSQVTEGITMASELKVGISEFYGNKGRHSAGAISLGLPAATSFTGNYVSSIATNTSGTITITYNQPKVSRRIAGLNLGFSPYVNRANQIIWICGSSSITPDLTMSRNQQNVVGVPFAGNMPTRYKPTSCKA